MRYIIAGKKETFEKYIKTNYYAYQYRENRDVIYLSSFSFIKKIKKTDIIVLLPGWFSKKWSFKFLKEVEMSHPSIQFEYFDGVIGERERKKLISDTISNRFDILDL